MQRPGQGGDIGKGGGERRGRNSKSKGRGNVELKLE